MNILLLPLFVSIFALFFTGFISKQARKRFPGPNEILEASRVVRESAIIYLKNQYKTIGLTAFVLFILFFILFSYKVALGFLVGVICASLAHCIGVMASTKASPVAVVGSIGEETHSFSIAAFKEGSTLGFLTAGLGLLAVSGFYLLTKDLTALLALGFGSSLVSFFVRFGGGAYSKAAQVGLSLVAMIKKDIGEDDFRSPAVATGKVGKNVGGYVNMAADFFDINILTIIGTMILGSRLFEGTLAIILPLLLSATALLASIVATFFIKPCEGKNSFSFIYKTLFTAGFLMMLGFIFPFREATARLSLTFFELYIAVFVGVFALAGIFLTAEYFTSRKHRPLKAMVQASEIGHAANIIEGLLTGMRSTLAPALSVVIIILVGFWTTGFYGLALTAITIASLAAIMIAMNACAASGSGNADFGKEDTGRTSRGFNGAINMAGRTYVIISAALTALILFAVYVQQVIYFGKNIVFLLDDPLVLVGLILGGLLPFCIMGATVRAVRKTAAKLMKETRRQFREITELTKGGARPEYSRYANIAVRAATKETLPFIIFVLIIPLVIGFLLGPKALGGLLVGSIIVGIFVALSATVSGTVWSRAREHVEGRSKKQDGLILRAVATGDTVGALCRDNVGAVIASMMKILGIMALLFLVFII